MDIAAVSMALTNVSMQTQVGTAVLDKAMETSESLGAGLVQMMDASAMELSVNPHLGANLDLRI
uniref:YjfB family protein n=1 Tax=Acetatifactor sp. TaxID=1872090 RepID=UPI0040571C86